MPRETYRGIPWMTDELEEYAVSPDYSGLVEQGLGQTQAGPARIPSQQDAYGAYDKSVRDQLEAYQKLYGSMQASQKEQREWEKAEREKSRSFVPDELMRIADSFIQNHVATLPGQYATTGGVLTRSLPNLDPVLRSMQAGSASDERARDERYKRTEAGIQRKRFDSDRDVQQMLQFAQLKGGLNEKLAQSAMQAEQALNQREWQQKAFDQNKQQQDRMFSLQKAQHDATLAKYAYDAKMTTRKLGIEYGEDVAKQYASVRDKMSGDGTFKAMQTIANDSKIAMDQMIQASKEQDPTQMAAALSALLKSYSGAAASDSEAARALGGNISFLTQALNMFETEYAGGMPPPDVINGYLRSMSGRINSANQRIEQISKYYKQTFNTYAIGQAANYGRPIDLGALDEAWSLNPSVVEPTPYDPKEIEEAIRSMPKITDGVTTKDPDAPKPQTSTGAVPVPSTDKRGISGIIKGMFE